MEQPNEASIHFSTVRCSPGSLPLCANSQCQPKVFLREQNTVQEKPEGFSTSFLALLSVLLCKTFLERTDGFFEFSLI